MIQQPNQTQLPNKPSAPKNYFGHIVRLLFFSNSLVLLVTFPLFRESTILPIFIGILLVIIMIVSAALTTPEYQFIHLSNIVVSLVGVILFETLAFATNLTTDTMLFVVRQGLGISFLFALYFSVRTVLKGHLKKKEVSEATSENSTQDSGEKSNAELLKEIKQKNDLR